MERVLEAFQYQRRVEHLVLEAEAVQAPVAVDCVLDLIISTEWAL